MKLHLTPIALASMSLFAGWAQAQETTPATQAEAPVETTVRLPAVEVQDRAEGRYDTRQISTATKTQTPLRDVPQSVTVITRDLVEDQAMLGIGDAMRYVPGVGMAQGEGNRETPILRGNATTSDFFVNGLRDDMQYYRDLYNIERIEVLKGPNAMIFGRGGVGGVINRVTRRADWESRKEFTLQGGSFGHQRVLADIGEGFNENVAGRVTAVYEDSESYRDGVTLERYGVNPTLALRLSPTTTAVLGHEYFHDERVADRGIASQDRKPFKTDDSTFFGNPDESPTGIELNVTSLGIEHQFGNGWKLRNSTQYGDYSKYYQNVFASGPVTGGNVPLQAYRADTDRQSLFNQTDLVLKLSTGSISHTLLGGVEFGRQHTENLRLTGRFADANGDGALDTTRTVSAASPQINEPLVDFAAVGASDNSNVGTAKVLAFYLQDQIQLMPQLQAVVGLRYDHFELDFTNRRATVPADRDIQTSDDLVSPRVGLVYKPLEPLSLYASYTLSYLPRAGEQLASLSATNKAFDPEEFRNYEIGAKWDFTGGLSLTTSVYRLDRKNVVLVNPTPGGPSILGDGSRVEGVELGLSGKLTQAWSIAGGYAYQDGKLTGTSNAASAVEGTPLAQLPKNTFSLWNRYDFTPMWGAGLGVYYRDDMYTSTNNTTKVTLDGYTRVDAAVYCTLSKNWRGQINVENLLGEEYYVNAHNDNNILPGSPIAVRASVTARF